MNDFYAKIREADLRNRAAANAERAAVTAREAEKLKEINVWLRHAPPCHVAPTIPSAQPSIDADRMADEIMARIERDGAVHKSSLIDVIGMITGKPTPPSGV